jgi:hypothetical protein
VQCYSKSVTLYKLHGVQSTKSLTRSLSVTWDYTGLGDANFDDRASDELERMRSPHQHRLVYVFLLLFSHALIRVMYLLVVEG